MSREVKRVPLNLDAPLREVWPGYLRPDDLDLPKCPDCDGSGWSPHARHLQDLWYGHAPFQPADNGSTPLTPDTPAVRAFAERNVNSAPGYYGTGEWAIRREAKRLADMWNGQWNHHLNADDVAALLAANRLHGLTHTWTRGEGWQRIDPPVVPTPEQVNEWNIRTMGHGSINCWAVVEARCEREGVAVACATCGGKGDIGSEEQRAAHEAWTPTDPPEGEGWQLWETVSEGSPISPVFATAEELATWMTRNKCTVHGPVRDFDTALRFVRAGWAPSLMSSPETGLVDGVTFVGRATT